MGTPCPPIAEIVIPEPPPAPMNLDAPESAPAPEASGSAAGSASGSAAGSASGSASDDGDATDDGEQPRRKIVVSLDPMEMAAPAAPKAPMLPEDYAASVIKHWTCELKIDAAIANLERGRLRILWVLIGTGLLLVLGLAVYGIKMTHKVAGPLFKVGLYLDKMRSGRFDRVYNLRKGDQLVDFYEHFKHAHAGVVAMQEADIERIGSVIAAAEAAGLGEEPIVGELRELLARKEKSVE
jgi:hypothetical protein